MDREGAAKAPFSQSWTGGASPPCGGGGGGASITTSAMRTEREETGTPDSRFA